MGVEVREDKIRDEDAAKWSTPEFDTSAEAITLSFITPPRFFIGREF